MPVWFVYWINVMCFQKSVHARSCCALSLFLSGSIQICPSSPRHRSVSVGPSPASAAPNPCRGNVLFLLPLIWNAMLELHWTGFYTTDVFFNHESMKIFAQFALKHHRTIHILHNLATESCKCRVPSVSDWFDIRHAFYLNRFWTKPAWIICVMRRVLKCLKWKLVELWWKLLHNSKSNSLGVIIIFIIIIIQKVLFISCIMRCNKLPLHYMLVPACFYAEFKYQMFFP